MNSRERVRAALEHREPDRVPIDLGGTRVTGINAVGYHRLKQRLGLDAEPVRVADIILQLGEVEEEVRQRFHVDAIGLPLLMPVPGVRNIRWQPWTLPDGSPCVISADFRPERTADGTYLIRAADGSVPNWMPPGIYYFLPRDHPLADATLEELARWEPGRMSDEELEFLRQAAKRLHDDTEYAVCGWFSGSLMEHSQQARGWDRFLMDLVADPPFARLLIEKLAQKHLANLARYLDAAGEYLDVIGFSDDLGIQTGLQISPALYRKYFAAWHRQLYGMVHERTRAKVLLHSCGSVYDLLPDLIEAGVDVLNPVQTSAAKMEPWRLKSEFGERLSFWGGGSCPQRVLPVATPGEVEESVRSRLRAFGPGGGFVFAPIHDLQPDVPPENVCAMYDAAYHWGAYPLDQLPG